MYCNGNPVGFVDPSGEAIVPLRKFVEGRNGIVTPIHYFNLPVYGLKQIDVTLYNKTVTYTQKDYKIINNRAYIDDTIVARDFGTRGVGAAKPYNFVQAYENDINCYAYAIGFNNNAQPGFKSDFRIDYTKPYGVDQVASLVQTDLEHMNRKCRIIESYDSPILEDERRIAVRVGSKIYNGNGYDYHFMKQNSDGTWSEKHGIGGNSIHHNKGENPENIPWKLDNNNNYYDSDIIYMAITD